MMTITPSITITELNDAVPGIEIWGDANGDWLAMFAGPDDRPRSWSVHHSPDGRLDLMGPRLVGAVPVDDLRHLLELLRALRVIPEKGSAE